MPSRYPHLSAFAAALLLLLLAAGESRAANWIAVQGADPATQPTHRLRGFIQTGYQQNFGEPVEGLTGLAQFNGQQAIFNVVGPEDATRTFFLRRARLSAQGLATIQPAPIGYRLQAEFAPNILTRTSAVVLTDAFLHARILPGLRVKLGQFKLPTLDEGLEGNPYVGDFIHYTGAALLLNENPIRRNPATAINEFSGGGFGFRDVGVQVYDWHRIDRWEGTYAVALSNGRMGLDDNNAKDVSTRVQLAYVFDGKTQALERDDAMLFAWYLAGRRPFAAGEYPRIRKGVGAQWDVKPFRVRAEYVLAQGMIETGLAPPFVGGSPGLVADGTARAWYVEGGWRFLPRWEANARYDVYDRIPDDFPQRRIFRTATLGTQFVWSPLLRVLLNYDIRRLEAPGGNADAQILADAMADRATLQAVIGW